MLIHPKSHVCLFCLERKGWSDDFPTQVLLLFLSLSLKSNLPRNCKAPKNSSGISIFARRRNPMIMIVTRLPTTITTRRTTPEWSKGALRRGGRLLVDRSWEGLSNVGWWDFSYIHISHCSEVFFSNELSIMSARWSGWCCGECWHRGTDPVTTRSSAIFSKYCDADLISSHHHHHYYHRQVI